MGKHSLFFKLASFSTIKAHLFFSLNTPSSKLTFYYHLTQNNVSTSSSIFPYIVDKQATKMMQELFNSGSFSDEKKLLNSSETQQSIRCPRCDSPNTKFCYYNNYNLTQPRHFCKTCRRYWTKGGALRNVPIGGGCRKARPLQSTMAAANFTNGTHKSGYNRTAKLPAANTDQFDAACYRFLPAATMWDNMPHDSHLLALLKASQLQQQQQQLWQPNILNDVPTSSGIQEFYQRLKSSTTADYYSSSSAATTTAPVNMAEPIPLSVDVGSWNSNVSWSDIWTTNATNNN